MAIYKHFMIGVLPLFILGCSDKEEDMQQEMGSMDDPAIETMQSANDAPVTDEATAQVADDQPPADVPVPAYSPNDIVMAVDDRGQQVRLVLTPSDLTMKLSADSVTQLRSQVRSRDLKDDLKAAILASVTEVAMNELQEATNKLKDKIPKHEIRYSLDTVNSIHYQNERLWVDLAKEKPLSFDDIKTADGRPVLANFDAADATSFVAAFELLKGS